MNACPARKMDGIKKMDLMEKKGARKNLYRVAAMALLLISACILTYYFHNVARVGKVFTHLFYIPIFLSSLWWKKKGLVVALFLAGLLLLSHGWYRMDSDFSVDYLRALMFLCIGYVVALLSEKIKRSEMAAKDSREIYKTIFETTGTATIIIEPDTSIFLVNSQFERFSGYSKEEIEGRKYWTEFFSKKDLDMMTNYHHIRRIAPDVVPACYESRFVNRIGGEREVLVNAAVIPGTKRSVASISDISPVKEAERDREILQKKLEEALTHMLSGFIPICANCKRIRDAEGQWTQVEAYISDHSKAQFSHSICPECGMALYGDFLKEKGSL